MRKTLLLALMAAGAWSGDAAAARSVVILRSSPLDAYAQAAGGFAALLAEKDKTVKITDITLNDDGDSQRTAVASAEPSVIFVLGTRAAKYAKDAMLPANIVFCLVLDPSLLGPPAMGVTMDLNPDAFARGVAELIPGLKTAGTVYTPKSEKYFQSLSKAFAAEKIELKSAKISSVSGFDRALDSVADEVNCFIMLPDPDIYFKQSSEKLILEGLKRKFAVIGLSAYYTKAGALASFESDYSAAGAQAAGMAWELLNGKNPYTIPWETPEKLVYSINMVTADRLDFKLPTETLKRAQKVYGR